MQSYGFEEPYPAMLALLLRKAMEKEADTGLRALEKFMEMLSQFRDKTDDEKIFLDYLPEDHRKEYAQLFIDRLKESMGTFECSSCGATNNIPKPYSEPPQGLEADM